MLQAIRYQTVDGGGPFVEFHVSEYEWEGFSLAATIESEGGTAQVYDSITFSQRGVYGIHKDEAGHQLSDLSFLSFHTASEVFDEVMDGEDDPIDVATVAVMHFGAEPSCTMTDSQVYTFEDGTELVMTGPQWFTRDGSPADDFQYDLFAAK